MFTGEQACKCPEWQIANGNGMHFEVSHGSQRHKKTSTCPKKEVIYVLQCVQVSHGCSRLYAFLEGLQSIVLTQAKLKVEDYVVRNHPQHV